MKRLTVLMAILLLTVVSVACNGPAAPDGATPTQQAAAPTAEPSATTQPPTPTLAPTETAQPPTPTVQAEPSATPEQSAPVQGGDEGDEQQEAILILEPGPASRVTSPVRVSGEADPTFEQSLAVRIITIDGDILVTEPAMIEAELGERGPFAVDVPFTVSEETQAWIQVFATSARDGGITHLSSVGLMLAPDGEEDIVAVTPHPERIAITSPEMGATISGGELLVQGRGLASFEQTLIVELLDEEGRLITMTPVIVDAPDLGEWGDFEATLTFEVGDPMPARVRVYDPSPAFGGEVHAASVEVQLE